MNMHDRFDSEVIMYDQLPINSKSTTPVTKQMMVAGKIHHQDIQRFEHTGMMRGSIDTSIDGTTRERPSSQAMHRRSSATNQVIQTDQSCDLNNLNRRHSNHEQVQNQEYTGPNFDNSHYPDDHIGSGMVNLKQTFNNKQQYSEVQELEENEREPRNTPLL